MVNAWKGPYIAVLEEYASVNSTNEVGKLRIREGCRPGTVIWAHSQTAGRGRRGRSWLSHSGTLTFSVLLRLEQPALIPTISMAAGVWTVKALKDIAPDIRVKWPNDIWYDQRKLGGILGEVCRISNQTWVVLGIGVNVNGEIPQQAENWPISLEEISGRRWDLVKILERIISQFNQELGAYLTGGCDVGRELSLHGNFLGKTIFFRQTSGDIWQPAVAERVLPDGRLQVRLPSGEVRLLHQEISLRRH